MKEEIEKIKMLVARANMKRAFEEAKAVLEHLEGQMKLSPKLDELTSLMASYETNKKSMRSGVITNEKFAVEQKRILHEFLNLLERLNRNIEAASVIKLNVDFDSFSEEDKRAWLKKLSEMLTEDEGDIDIFGVRRGSTELLANRAQL